MDVTVAEFIRRTVLKVPRSHIPALLQAWGFLPAARLQALDVRPLKEAIAEAVVQLCQVSAVLGLTGAACLSGRAGSFLSKPALLKHDTVVREASQRGGKV